MCLISTNMYVYVYIHIYICIYLYMRIDVCIHECMCIRICTYINTHIPVAKVRSPRYMYGVATISRLLKIACLFCKRAL